MAVEGLIALVEEEWVPYVDDGPGQGGEGMEGGRPSALVDCGAKHIDTAYGT